MIKNVSYKSNIRFLQINKL